MQDIKQKPHMALNYLISMPFIYSVLIPFVLLDIGIEIYHRICFPLYGLEYVKRSDYIKIDRQYLSYLNFIQKINCMYCGYGNGLLHYASVIAGITETYWCGIKHKKYNKFKSPSHHKSFLDYNNESKFNSFTKK
jgi:hypothetical protein